MCSVARIKPAVLQCESHPYLIQNELINHIKRYDIVCRCPLFLILVYSRNTVLDLEKKVSYLWELLLHALARSTYGIILVRQSLRPSAATFPGIGRSNFLNFA